MSSTITLSAPESIAACSAWVESFSSKPHQEAFTTLGFRANAALMAPAFVPSRAASWLGEKTISPQARKSVANSAFPGRN